MQIRELRLSGPKLIFPRVSRDNRGFFIESYQQPRYFEQGIDTHFIQDNHSYSKRATVRGMHFQTEPGQAKLVRVSHGKIFDAIVDIRVNSKTFGQWEAVILDGESHAQLFIPIGFAHGFCVLSEEAHVIYKASSVYNVLTEQSFRWNDPEIGIVWPIDEEEMILSERDRSSPYFSEVFNQQNLGDNE
jgi:dTDP-4-dehydrorhamnose 3,5-epimerase